MNGMNSQLIDMLLLFLSTGLNHVVRKESIPLETFCNLLITVPGGRYTASIGSARACPWSPASLSLSLFVVFLSLCLTHICTSTSKRFLSLQKFFIAYHNHLSWVIVFFFFLYVNIYIYLLAFSDGPGGVLVCSEDTITWRTSGEHTPLTVRIPRRKVCTPYFLIIKMHCADSWFLLAFLFREPGIAGCLISMTPCILFLIMLALCAYLCIDLITCNNFLPPYFITPASSLC